MRNDSITRRNMLKKTAAASSVMAFPALISSSALGRAAKVAPSDRLNIALISCGSRSGVTEQYKNYSKSEVVAVTEYPIGAVSPLGLPNAMRILIDRNVLQNGEISIGSGVRNTTIIMDSDHLLGALDSVEVGDFINPGDRN